MNELSIRLFQPEDAEAVSRLIVHTLYTSNIRDYSPEYIAADAAKFTPADVLVRASWTHFYVVCTGNEIIGCGAIGPYWGKEDESSLFNIFVHPDYQGRGIGKTIIKQLEQDEFFLRAKRVEIPASVTGCQFYRALGYDYKNGVTELDDERLYRLEKFRGEDA